MLAEEYSLTAVSKETRYQIHQKVGWAAMATMFDLRNVLWLVIDSFREDEPPMSHVTRNGAFLARALGDKPICELLSPQGRFCSTWGVNRYDPGKPWGSREANLIQRQRAFFQAVERIYRE